jgi:DNA mismatch repair protein MutL
MGKIQKLDQHTTNLIAAGEVIERAASVVKELVENSIDAEATKISISLTDAGQTEIVVSDNGIGMDSVDAKLCVEPHSTSKIRNEKDLFRINTLGFRGEALPSIVSVSNFRLKTSSDGLKGILYSLKGGTFVSEAVIASPRGTEISVRNLFFNTPARLQNLQAQNVELSYIVDYVNRIAFSKPGIAFKLTNNDHLLLQTFGNNNLLEVIAQVYDNDVAKNMLEIFESNGYFQVGGYISNLNISRATKNQMTIIVNGRVIRSNRIINAIMDGYKERLVTGRYPIVVLNIVVDPALIDVNIHPAKHEVRFSNEAQLLNLITHVVSYALMNSDLIVDVEEKGFSEELDFEEAPLLEEPVPAQNELQELPSLEDFDFKLDNEEPAYYAKEDLVKEEEPAPEITQYQQQEYSLQDDGSIKDEPSAFKLPKMYYIGQLHGTYLLFQDEDNFYMIDQHAAYERINYEKIRTELFKEDQRSYELLIPLKLNFAPSEALLVNEGIPTFEKMGIVVENFGAGTFTVREIPFWIPKDREKEFLEEIISGIARNRRAEKSVFLDSLAKTLACKRSIKANQFLDRSSIEVLINDLSQCENPYNCPHGRPIIIKFKSSEIEKWFRRVV